MKRILLVLFLTLFSGVSMAQVVNGGFDGSSGWTWEKSEFSWDGYAHCGNAQYSSTAGKVWWRQSPPASGYVAGLTGSTPYASGSWIMCRQIAQSVYVAPGSQLSFVAKIGDDLSAYDNYSYNAMTLSVVIIDSVRANTIVSLEGSSRRCGFTGGCSKFQSYVVDLSPYWGQTVKLIFRGATGGSNNNLGMVSQPSSAFVDNISIR